MTLVTPAAPVVAPRAKRKVHAQPAMPAFAPVAQVAPGASLPSAAVGVAHLPMRSVGVGASVRVGGWAIPLVGALAGGLFFGLPGALVGGIGGYLLARG